MREKENMDSCGFAEIVDTVNTNGAATWIVKLNGPNDTPYERGRFKLEIRFSNMYPWEPPTVRFLTKIFHPNIWSTGDICMDILKSEWSPAVTPDKLLLSIQSLMAAPNPYHRIRGSRQELVRHLKHVSKLCRKDEEEFKKTARLWTEKYSEMLPIANESEEQISSKCVIS